MVPAYLELAVADATGITVIPIPTENVAEWWPRVCADVDRALKRGWDTHQLQDIYYALSSGDMGLAVIHDQDEYLGCAVTQLVQYPREIALRVVILVGKRFEDFAPRFQVFIDEALHFLGADFAEFSGRMGWVKKLKRFGWRHPLINMIYRPGNAGKRTTDHEL